MTPEAVDPPVPINPGGTPEDTVRAANEQLVLTMLRSQAAAETASREQAFREQTAALRLESQRLIEQNRQMLEAARLKSQFLATMSHELRTPLNAIMGFTHLLLAGSYEVDSPKYRVFLEHIANSSAHLLKLINSLLDLSKVEAGKVEFDPQPLDLAAAVQEVIHDLAASALRMEVEIQVDIGPGLDDLVLDRTRLRQVLSNYLSNAIKFSPPGSQVTLRARTDGATNFAVEVEDHGIGIAAADQPLLFVAYSQLHAGNSRTYEGTGLGLALVRLLVEAQGGSVSLTSKVGQGSVFGFVLPRHGEVRSHATGT